MQKKKLGLSHPYRIWGKEKESQICSFPSSSRKINQFTVNRYIESCPCSRSRNNLVRLVKILAGEFKIKNLCGILFVYWQLKLRIVFPVLLLPQQNEIQPAGMKIRLVFKAVWPWKIDIKFSHAYVSDECQFPFLYFCYELRSCFNLQFCFQFIKLVINALNP